VTGIFAYLTACSIRNSVRVRLRRLRQPRYLVIAAGFLLYIGSAILGRPRSGSFASLPLETMRARTIAAGIGTLFLASAWILPVGAALRFTNAEIQFLFPAPIARRQLIGYKLIRMLLASALTGAFLTIFVGPTRLGPALFFAAKSAIVMVVITLHGAGIATYRANASDVGGLSRRRWGIVTLACLLTPIAGAALAFVALSSPMQFVAAVPVAALIVGVNALWIVRTDTAFEEAATEAAEKMNRAVAAGHFLAPRKPRKRSRRFRLAPHGPVETAILWKNWLLLGRMSRQATITMGLILAGIVIAFVVGSNGEGLAEVIGAISVVAVALAVLLGPAMLRVDLRHDLANLALIKTWPVRGAALIRGELLAPAAALSLSAAAAIVIGTAIAPELLLVAQPTAGARAVFGLSAIIAMSGLILAQLLVHNAIAVTFPAWVEVKVTSGAAAMEMNIRMMIVMYGSLLVLPFVVMVPAAAAYVAYMVTDGLLVPSVMFTVLIAAECLVATEILGRMLDRTDLHDVVVTE
jgi:hypothetical protein